MTYESLNVHSARFLHVHHTLGLDRRGNTGQPLLTKDFEKSLFYPLSTRDGNLSYDPLLFLSWSSVECAFFCLDCHPRAPSNGSGAGVCEMNPMYWMNVVQDAEELWSLFCANSIITHLIQGCRDGPDGCKISTKWWPLVLWAFKLRMGHPGWCCTIGWSVVLCTERFWVR